MSIDLQAKSTQLLQKLVNSLIDRNQPPLFFSPTEIQLVEEWLVETVDEIKKAGSF
jgi:hypothetical protein